MPWQRLGGDTDLARYRLTAPHFVTNRLGVPALKEAGSILDSLDLPPHWQPTPAMEPLDDEAEAEHAKVMHAATASGTQVEITGFGHLRDLPRGNEHLPKAYPTARLKSRYYWVSAPFTYTSKSGVARMVDPKDRALSIPAGAATSSTQPIHAGTCPTIGSRRRACNRSIPNSNGGERCGAVLRASANSQTLQQGHRR